MAGHSDISFRSASPADIPLIQDLSSHIWGEHYPGIITHDQIDYMLGKMYAAAVIREEIEHGGWRYFVAVQGSNAVGYFAYRFDDDSRTVSVSKLYLLPSLHGRGIGRRMLQHVKEDAVRLGAERITLFVNKRNTKAIRAYERFGFTKAETVVTDIGSGFVMDDYRMELTL